MTQPRRMPLWARIISIVVSIVAIVIISTILIPQALQPGPAQPIPFSHHLHVTTKQLNCFFCHNTAAISKNAGMPPVRKCLLCHNVIAAKFRPIAKIHTYYNQNKAIPWVRVYRLPEFVQFQHQPHIARGFDCSECHGNVAQMDRITAVHQLNMRFCVSCHWKNKAPDSCFTCHY